MEKDGVFQGVVTWNEIIKIQQEQRDKIRVEQMPLTNIFTFPDEGVFEAYKLMTKEKIDLLPVVDRETHTKVVGVLTSGAVANAYEKAKSP